MQNSGFTLFLEIAIFGFSFFSLIVTFFIIRSVGRGSLSTPFISFAVGTLLVGLSRVFLFIADRGVYHLEDVTMHIWWHLILYFGLFAFIFGGSRLKKVATSVTGNFFNGFDFAVLSLLTSLAILVFFIAQPLEVVMDPVFVGSFVDKFGLYHFIAMVLAAISGIYIYQIKSSWGKLLSVSVYPLLAFLFLTSLQHLWEAASENWKIISITPDGGEEVERFIVLPALFFLAFGFWRIARFISRKEEL